MTDKATTEQPQAAQAVGAQVDRGVMAPCPERDAIGTTNLPQQLRDIAEGMNATRNQAALREAAADIERLWASERALIEAMRDEIDEGLRLRELGGAMPDENITVMTERLIKERLNLAAMLRKCAHALRNRGREDLASDVVGLLRCYDLLGSPLRDGQP